jgi:Flp pilus assembly protein TadG
VSSSSCSRRPSHRRSRGQGLIEFALIAPLLIGLAFGIFDFGRAESANLTVTNGAREAARYLVAQTISKGSGNSWGNSCPWSSGTQAPASDSGAGKAWKQLQAANLDLTKVTITVYYYSSTSTYDPSADTNHAHADLAETCGGSSATPTASSSYTVVSGDWVVVSVQYVYATTTPVISQLFPHLTMNDATTMVVE